MTSVDEVRASLSRYIHFYNVASYCPSLYVIDANRSGEPVIVAIPERTARSHIMLPSLLPAQYQKRFSTVIRDVATTGNSGSGVFDAGQKCLLGIVSLKIYQTPSTEAPESEHRDIRQIFCPGIDYQGLHTT
jgi:hypothetical protein